MVNYEFRYVVKMTNGKEYEIITNFHGKKDVLKYIDSHDYIDLFDRKIGEMVAVKSEYVMSVLYKDSKKTDSEGNVNWTNREDYLEEENERLQQENERLQEQLEDNDLKLLEDVRHYSIKCKDLKKENKKLKEELRQSDYVKASVFSDREEYKKQIVKLHEELKTMEKLIKEYEERLGMEELVKSVEQWSKDKGLDKGNSFVQLAKFFEESGEVAAALCRDNHEDLKDGIGDVVVTMIILAQQNGMNLEECLEQAYGEIKDRKGKMSKDGSFIKESDIIE